MCGKELAISFGKIFIVENGIFGRLSFTPRLYPTKVA